jgi:hypothetical protein
LCCCYYPALQLAYTDNSTLADLLPGVVDSTLELVLESQGPERNPDEGDRFLSADKLPGDFKLLFDENTGFEYGSERK